jgi:RNA polymerase sigma-70 factor (ECF subfamily)
MMNHDDFEQAALRHMPVLQNYALHLTMDSENAKDLLQDTYLKAYRFWGHFEKGTNIKAWLCRIMKNSHINRYRKGKNEPTKVCYEEYHLPHGMTQETLFAHRHMMAKTYDEVFGDEIIRSIESMKDTFRDIIFLSDVEGLTYEEIAKTVGCPMGTVRSRLHRSRKLLKKKLLAYARDNGYITKRSSV